MQSPQHQQGERQPQGEGFIERMAFWVALGLQPAEGEGGHHQRQGQQLQAEAGEPHGQQDGGGEAVEEANQPVLEQGGDGQRQQGQSQPERGRVGVNLVDEAIEQPGIGRERERQHELIPEIATPGQAVEAEGGGHQQGAHDEGVVRFADQALEGHEQEEQQEEGGQPAHHAEQEAARPVRLLVPGGVALHQMGGPQPLPRAQIRHVASVVVAASGWPSPTDLWR
ncbi:hypothetical protein D3C72_1299170 [compost metagenome]